MAEFKDRLNQALKDKNIKASELSKLTGIGEGAISQYRKGAYKASQENLELLARALKVPIAWLMGAEVSIESSSILNDPRILPIEKKKIPLLGTIACGEPIYKEDFESYVIAGTQIKADAAVRAKGESMINARIHDGDLVFIKYQPMVENGEIAAVWTDDGCTIKRVYRYGDTLVLRPENPDFTEIIYTEKDRDSVKILGKAVAFQSDIK